MEINQNAICESLVCGRVLSRDTFEAGKKHDFEIPRVKPNDIYTTDYETSLFVDKFIECLEKTCEGKSSIALALSGGKDSRTILALLRKIGVSPVCVTWSYREDDPEVRAAKKICEKFNLKHEYIRIVPGYYFIPENEKELIKLANGSPLYFDMMLWYAIRNRLGYDVVFCGNLMTEYMDTAEYRRYEGSDLRKALYHKETLVNIVSPDSYKLVENRLSGFYYNENLDRVIVERMLDRVTQYYVMRNFINWNYPILDKVMLKELFSIPYNLRMGSKLTRYILKNYAPELYKMPTARSPFSLRWPLLVHQGYATFTRRKISKGLEHLLPQELDRHNNQLIELLPSTYDFIDAGKIKYLFKYAEARTKRLVQARLLNLAKWTGVK